MDDTKRKRTFRQEASRKKPKSDGGPGGSFSGFGAKMMSKMGYTGGGLGRSGEGITEAIQVQLRNTKAGVGAVKEKSDQQKREERRKAEQNGEKYEDSSEEERAQRRKKKTSGTSTPSTAPPRPKKTIYDLEAAGIQVPSTLQSIVDASGQSVSTSALSLRGSEVPFQTSLAGRVQREVAAFGEAVDAVQTDAKNIEFEMDRLNAELESIDRQIAENHDISSRLVELREQKDWSTISSGLKALNAAYQARSFDKEAVAIIHPLFQTEMARWDPKSDALEHLADSLKSLRNIIDPSSKTADYQQPSNEVGRTVNNPLSSIFTPNAFDSEPSYRRNKSTTPYQTMFLTWWSQFHSALINDLEPNGPSASAFIHAIEVWKPVIPPFVFSRVMREIKRKIHSVLQRWNPRKEIKHKTSTPLPHWIFQWMPYDDEMFSEIKPKLRTILQIWPVERGVIPGIKTWTQAFSEVDQLLVKHLLPRLSTYLRDIFEINPAEQDLEPISAVTSWYGALSAQIIAELLHAEFTPKLLATLHSWLTYEGRNFEEIGQFLTWWKGIFPEKINRIPVIERDWDESYKLVNAALDLDGQELEKLALPDIEQAREPTPETPQFSKSVNTEPPRSARQEIEEMTFKDVVEAWCAEENLLLIPLRKADEKTGFPLFRITASATGKGGAVVYLKGDAVFAQNKKDKSVWDPVGLDEGLISKAEGK